MTFLSPSSTSLSLRLSSSFLICAAGSVFVELRELLADCAASRVSSRAVKEVSAQLLQTIALLEIPETNIPLSSKLVILDIDSMGLHVRAQVSVSLKSGLVGFK